jgi:RNA polymerase sigma-70 factor (ECF subfamily)
MVDPPSTHWTLIRDAAEGDEQARTSFVRLYDDVVRAALGARWRGSPLAREIDDAAQEVFLACFSEGGVLARADPDRPAGFRAFLRGVVRNVARRVEERRGRRERQADGLVDLASLEARDETLSRAFDRAWAVTVLRQALDLQEERAGEKGGNAPRRLEILRLKFQEGMGVSEIARAWNVNPNTLHTEYLRARKEFESALREIVRGFRGGNVFDLDAECERLAEHLG